MTILCFRLYTTVSKRFLKFAILCLIKAIFKVISNMNFVTYVASYFTIFHQKMKNLALYSIQVVLKRQLLA